MRKKMKQLLVALACVISLCPQYVMAQKWNYQFNPPLEEVKGRCGLRLGDKLPDVTLCSVDRDNVKLSEFCGKGNYVLIHFYSWYYCHPDNLNHIDLTHFYNKYHNSGLQILGILIRFSDHMQYQPYTEWLEEARINLKEKKGRYSLERKQTILSKYGEAHYMEWPHLIMNNDGNFMKSFRNDRESVPMNILVSPNGTVYEADVFGGHLGNILRNIYGF